MIVTARVLTLLAATTLVSASAGAEPTAVKPLQEWSGSVDAEALEKIAPSIVTTGEGWSILWKAWGQKGDPPAVDFADDFVTVTTTRGSKLDVNFQVSDKGDLGVMAKATRDLRPGFRFHLAVLPRSGIATVAGKPLATNSNALAPAPTALPYRPTEPVAGSLKI